VTRKQNISVISLHEKLAPPIAIVLGVAHGAGANLPNFFWLQALALTISLIICFHFARARRASISVMAALSFSLASALAAHSWLWQTLSSDAALGLALGCCVFAALMAGLAFLPTITIVVASALVTKDSSKRFAPLALALLYPLSEMTTAEFIGFASHSVGYAWVETPLAVVLPTIGVYGAGAVVVGVCAWLASASVTWWSEPVGARRVPWPAIGILSCVVIALSVVHWSNHRNTATTQLPGVRTRLVQTDQPLHQKFDAERVDEMVDELVGLASGGDAQLIVAPETAIPVAWVQLPEALREKLARVVVDPERLFLLGLFDFRDDGGQLNVSAALREKPGSDPPPRYAKRRLMPIAEYSPPGLAWIADLLALAYDDRVTDDAPGPAFEIAGVHLANTICLDLSFPAELSDDAAITGIIVNQSNFVAFEGERVREQFLAIARTRALEQGKPVVMASNSGPTAAIGADGRVLARLPSKGAGVLDVVVAPGAGATIYATLGELAWIALLALAAVVAAFVRGPSRT
jgi:apolipoprotein N-acyltransferase